MPSQSLAATAGSRDGNIHGFCLSHGLFTKYLAGMVDEIESAIEYRRETLARRIRQEYSRRLDSDAVLLCWDAPGKFCHKRLVASWLEEGVRHMVLKYKPSQKLLFRSDSESEC